jgi:CDP-glycerol glycerophosphotransferase (TagB/SpsB family)
MEEDYGVGSYKKTILWMPTFRKCDNEEISEHYLDEGTGLPLLTSQEKLNNFNKFLAVNNILFLLKLHHLQSEMPVFKQEFSNIKIVRDEELAAKGIQLYQFIPHTDALVTDYSSIATDYMLLDKPMVFILDDYDEYRKSRGIYPENALELMAGYHVFSLKELEQSIIEISRGEDKYKTKRDNLLPQFHTYQDGCASRRILEHLEIVG